MSDESWASRLERSMKADELAATEARVNHLAEAFGRPISDQARAALYTLDRYGELAPVRALRDEIAKLAAAAAPPA